MQVAELIVVTLILVVEVVDVFRHWSDRRK
jgi:hypothetical protein